MDNPEKLATTGTLDTHTHTQQYKTARTPTINQNKTNTQNTTKTTKNKQTHKKTNKQPNKNKICHTAQKAKQMKHTNPTKTPRVSSYCFL
jgi:hypothetical protein